MNQTTTVQASAGDDSASDPRQPRRVRHETKRRALTVKSVTRLSPSMIRVVLQGDDLTGFNSASFEDHIKLFVPDGTSENGEPKTAGRNYTPRRYDADAGELIVDFAIHEAGPATRWAERAKPGQPLSIGGPRGSFVIPMTAHDWHLLVADDTGLPAIARRLEELPAGTRIVVVAEVDSKADEIPLPTEADASIHWIHRDGTPPGRPELLVRALRSIEWPAGDYFAWVACEAGVAKTLRAQLLTEHDAKPKWTRAAAYWREGVADVHENLKDEEE